MVQKDKLIEIKEYNSEGYKPLVDYDSWRVAVLNYCTELLPKNIKKVQKHDETDEVFVLLKGKCILFIVEDKNIFAYEMKPLKLYNIKRSVWHTHTLSKDAVVLIVENSDTNLANSPEKKLTKKQQKTIAEYTKNLWSKY